MNQYQLNEYIEKNDKKYEVRQIIHRVDEYQHKTYGHLQLNAMSNEIEGCLHVFAGRTPSILVDSGDYMELQWTIYRLVK